LQPEDGDATIVRIVGASDQTTENQGTLPRARGAGPIHTSLIVYHGERVEVVPLGQGESRVLGRAAPADLVVDAPSLSRRHARFTRVEGGVRVEDLDSTNGTWFGGERLRSARLLRPGEAVHIGPVTVSVDRTAERAGLVSGIEGYERFLARVQDEVIRSRTFLRGVAVLMLRALDGRSGHVSRWVPKVHARLRPVDRLALYGKTSALVVLPETNRDRALAVVSRLLADDPNLVAGVAVDGSSAEALIDTARTLARRADASRRVVAERNDAAGSAAAPVFASEAMLELSELVDRVANAKIPVMVLGETGVGKEVVARAIHDRSPRAREPLKTINCGAMPAELLEALLFGHEKGAFTGADATRPGLFEQADGGTLFLDEVAELSPSAQTALLRILESKTVVRVGGQRELPIDVRIVVATHGDLEAMVQAGSFREDLLFRLNSITVRVPPLRARPGDLEPLIHRFLDEASEGDSGRRCTVSAEALQVLRAYRWPGNVRELRNAIDRATVLCEDDTIEVGDLPAELVEAAREAAPAAAEDVDPDADFRERVRAYETRLIVDAMRRSGGIKTKAAELLRIPVRTLSYKIKSYGIGDLLEEE